MLNMLSYLLYIVFICFFKEFYCKSNVVHHWMTQRALCTRMTIGLQSKVRRYFTCCYIVYCCVVLSIYALNDATSNNNHGKHCKVENTWSVRYLRPSLGRKSQDNCILILTRATPGSSASLYNYITRFIEHTLFILHIISITLLLFICFLHFSI